MPKSKNRRKKGKKAKRKSSQKPSPTVGVEGERGTASIPPPKPPKRSIKEALLKDKADGLARLVLYSPLVIGAWIGAGIVLDELVVFGILTVSVMLSHFYQQVVERDDVLFAANLKMIVSAGQVGILFLLFHQTQHPGLVGAAAGLALLATAEAHLPLDKPLGVIGLAMSYLLRMTLFGIAGILSQQYTSNLGHYWLYGVYGFAPGCVLGAYIIARYEHVFVEAGWRFRELRADKKGEEVLRPGRITQLYSVPLLFGSVLPCIGVPFGFFPTPFLAPALGYLVLPKIAQAFLEREGDSRLIIPNWTAASAGGLSLVMLLAGVLARYGIY